jgi:DNA mismatch repair protein MutS2
MNRNTSRTLEFEAIRSWLLSYAGSPMGRTRLASLAPHSDPARARAALAATSEARTALASQGRQPYHDLPDVREILPKAGWAGFGLEPRELLEVASFAQGATEIGQALARSDAPTIAAHAARIADFRAMAGSIRRAVLPSGEIADDASPRLSELRRNLLRMRTQLQSLMESFVQGRDADRVLQEKLVTTRNDRYVLLIKAEQRGQVPGIIHGRSGSGASVFVEPLPAVELNNDIVSLQDEEREEIARILQLLTQAVGTRQAELLRAIEIIGELDALQAMASASVDVDGIAPEITTELRLRLRRARHPLLLSAVTERLGQAPRSRREAVPIDIELQPAAPVLVISGPNTGGKTVALKTVGLLSLMAATGLHIPAAAGSVLPLFRRVYADIGDEQSIAGDLSTFSAHLAAIQEMTRDLEPPALVLLDEVGAGTDPTEGGALGVAIVDYFRQRGAMVLTTTHHGLMKAYSQSTPGVASASFGYHPQTFEPTYELRLGEAGRSLALEITQRLGLPQAIVDDARARLGDKEQQVEALARRLEEDREELATRERRLAERERAMAAAVESQREAVRVHEAERRKAAESFAAELKRRTEVVARQAADAVREAVQRVESSRRAAASEGSRARARAIETIREARDEALASVGVAVPATATARAPVAGDRVRVTDLGVVGDVVAVHDGELELSVSGKRLRTPIRSVTVLQAGSAAARGATASVVVVPRGHDDGPAIEINIVGMRVDVAIPLVDKRLDEAALADQHAVRVIHGYGQGTLRRAVADLLEGHPHVASFRGGGEREGGGGVTVVELKD